ncbi:MAG: hypothetical protein FWC30_03775 [Candidatus Bathyarchaeota archaeon]|nr:hypothetical protein [Candidatus Termiticorpusculum sp.]
MVSINTNRNRRDLSLANLSRKLDEINLLKKILTATLIKLQNNQFKPRQHYNHCKSNIDS